MRRFLMAKLEKWHEKTNRKPLVLSGARQVGKTWLLNEFGRTHFGNVAYVNFDKTEAAKELFGGGFDFKGIIAGLQAVCNVEIKPHDTLIVFDEIQTCPSALKLLKYWQEDFPEYCVAAAGSLIGLALMEGTGYPVGKTDSMTLHPMCFREFLEATGEERLSELVASGDGKLWNAFHDTLSRRLKDYLLVGGMPAAVAAFAANRSYAAAREVQNGILSDYDRKCRFREFVRFGVPCLRNLRRRTSDLFRQRFLARTARSRVRAICAIRSSGWRLLVSRTGSGTCRNRPCRLIPTETISSSCLALMLDSLAHKVA